MDYANIILLNKGEVLLQLRDNKPNLSFAGLWCLPGGGIEPNEEPRHAAIREFLEETGYQLHDPVFFTDYPYTFLPQKEGQFPRVHVFYEKYDNRQPINCFEGQCMAFKNRKEIDSLRESTFPTHTNTILEVLKSINNVN